MIIKVWSEI